MTSLAVGHRQLGERGVEQTQVILGRSGRALPGARWRAGPGRGVEEGDHWRETEAVLVVGRTLCRVRIDEGGVDVDHVEARVHPGRQAALERWPSSLDALEGAGVGRLEGAHIVGTDATWPKRPGGRRAAHVAQRGGPIGNGHSHVDSTWPRSWPRRRLVGAMASDSASVRPTSSASSHSSRARRGRPRLGPGGHHDAWSSPLRFISEVPSWIGFLWSRNRQFPSQEGFSLGC